MKCRLDVRGEGAGDSVPLVGNALSGSAVGKGPVEETAPEKPPLGDGGFDEPPSWARKPELAAPAPDLDDTFAGRGPDTGGYRIGGGAGQAPSGPAVSDAFSIMTSGNALSGSDVEDRRRGKRARRNARRKPPSREVPGLITGLPPALGDAGFPAGMQSEDFRPPAPAGPHSPTRAGPEHFPGKPAPVPGAGTLGEAAAPVPGSQGDPAGPWPSPFETPPSGFRGAHGEAGPARRRPVPVRTEPAGAQRPRRPGTGRKVSMPDLSLLKGIPDAFTPRVIVGAFGGVLVLLAIAYLIAGGGFFSSDARNLLEASRRAMRGLESFHLQAEVLMNTEKAGSVTTAVTADVSRDIDFRAAFAEAVYHPALEYVTASGNTYKSTLAGTWEVSGDRSDPDFTSAALFAGVSGSRLIDRQVVDGVECDHIAYEGGTRFVESFFPGVEATEATTAAVEIWVDPQTKCVRHVRVDAGGLETIKLGRFDCHVEASLSGFNAPVEIKPPV